MCQNVGGISKVWKTGQKPEVQDTSQGILMKRSDSSITIGTSRDKKPVERTLPTISETKVETEISFSKAKELPNQELSNRLKEGFRDETESREVETSETFIPEAPPLPTKISGLKTEENPGKVSFKDELKQFVETNKPDLKKLEELDKKVSNQQMENAIGKDVVLAEPKKIEVDHSEIKFSTDSQIKDTLKGGVDFKGFLEKYDKTSFHTLKMKGFETTAQNLGRQIFGSLPPNGDMVFTLTMKTDAQLKEIVTQALVDFKGPSYEGKNYSDLSANKKTLVDAIVKGINQALPNSMSSNKVNVEKVGEISDKITIGSKTFEKPEYLAEGSFGKIIVYKDQTDNNKEVVLKALDPSKLENTIQEIKAHKQLMGKSDSVEFIPDLKGIIKGKDGTLYMVMERIKGPDLSGINSTLNTIRDKNLLSQSDLNLVTVFLNKGQTETLDYIQKKGMYHGDIKPMNMMYDTVAKKVVAIDFGNSMKGTEFQYEDSDAGTNKYGTLGYIAPEIRQMGTFTSGADKFALGQSMHEIAKGKKVISEKFQSRLDKKENEILEAGDKSAKKVETVVNGQKVQTGDFSSLGKVINQTYAMKSEDRTELGELRKSEYFTDMDGSEERATGLLDIISDLTEKSNALSDFKQSLVNNPGLNPNIKIFDNLIKDFDREKHSEIFQKLEIFNRDIEKLENDLHTFSRSR